MTAITYIDTTKSMPSYTVFNPIIEENELSHLIQRPGTVYNPVNQTAIVYL